MRLGQFLIFEPIGIKNEYEELSLTFKQVDVFEDYVKNVIKNDRERFEQTESTNINVKNISSVNDLASRVNTALKTLQSKFPNFQK